MNAPASLQCPNCGAPIQKNAVACPACGSPLHSPGIQTEEQVQSSRQVVEEMNAYLVKSATSAAELAFSVGCTLGAIIILLLLVMVYFIITKTWTVVIVTGFIAGLISVGVSTILATRARNATLEKTYQRVTVPEIERYTRANRMSEDEFSNLSANVLPESAPLREFWNRDHQPERSET